MRESGWEVFNGWESGEGRLADGAQPAYATGTQALDVGIGYGTVPRAPAGAPSEAGYPSLPGASGVYGASGDQYRALGTGPTDAHDQYSAAGYSSREPASADAAAGYPGYAGGTETEFARAVQNGSLHR